MNKIAKLSSIILVTLGIFLLIGCGSSGGGSNTGGGNDTGGGNNKQFTVTFNSNGGSAVPSAHVQQGGTLSEPKAPTLKDHAFEGWYRDSGLTNKVTFPCTVNGSFTLYAKWLWLSGTQIYTAAQLDAIRNDLAGNYRLEADISLKTYGNWEPIGSNAAGFSGKIDGNGYKITGLKIDSEEEYAGLFGYVEGGVITNLALEDVAITKGINVGTIAGYISYGEISNCYSTGSISNSNSYSYNNYTAGGIAGRIVESLVSNCHSNADVIAKGMIDPLYSYNSAAGGIAGIMTSSKIKNSYSTGNIISNFHNTGGIVGYALDITISDCYSTGDISIYFVTGGNAGGIAGILFDSLVINCRSNADISATTYFVIPSSYVGGIAGLSTYTEISDCYSTGDISVYIDNYRVYSGGIVGYALGITISDCYSTGDISATGIAGGIAGYIQNSEISNCYSTGDISADSGWYIGQAGGIAGDVWESTISDCYSTGDISAGNNAYTGGIAGRVSLSTISDCYSTGDISAGNNAYAGGIAGWQGSSTIRNCAAINNTIATKYAGRITSFVYDYDDSVITNNFALNSMTVSGEVSGAGSAEMYHGFGKSDVQLRSKSTYSDPVGINGQGGLGWKFDGNNDTAPWKMPTSGSYPYPILYWQ